MRTEGLIDGNPEFIGRVCCSEYGGTLHRDPPVLHYRIYRGWVALVLRSTSIISLPISATWLLEVMPRQPPRSRLSLALYTSHHGISFRKLMVDAASPGREGVEAVVS